MNRLFFCIFLTLILSLNNFVFAKDSLFTKELFFKNLEKNKVELYFVDPLKNKKPKNACENEACLSLLYLIENAKESIDFAIYGIGGQDAIFNSLVDAQQRGVIVRGVVDMDSKNINPYKDTKKLISKLKTVKTDYKDSSTFQPKKEDYIQQIEYNINGEVIKTAFINKDIKNYNESIMHNKYFIIDKKYVYTGSMNISASCTNYNSNVSIVIKSQDTAQKFLNDFNQMYKDEKFHKEKKYIKNKSKIIQLGSNSYTQSFLLPEDEDTYYQIRHYIKTAKKYIYVPMFFFTHSKYPQDLIEAYNRGVDVKIILDATSVRTGYSKHKILRMAQIPVKIENWGGKMHMKSLIIDDKYILVGSMNFTSGAHYTNDENTILVKNTKIAKKFKKHFLYLWNSIPQKWLTDIPKPESNDSVGSCFDGLDNDHDNLVDGEDPDCQILYKIENPYNNKIFIQSGPIKD